MYGSGRGSLEVKVTDSRPACHESESSTVEDPPFRGDRCTLNMSRLKSLTIGVEIRKGGQLRCRPHHLTMVKIYGVRRQKPLSF
ncbi:hypothetical protein TNCV_4886321 [Trichonephila clavipes]|uniref:Uncharacterized protein n=1 Tax=Trichonephila clavipes TaxID=2585209 RepID=A0A8X6RQH8_TRICX|nr:hypothetical protein TNCV_4886321 [Trichonephila clavipes]